MQQHLLLLDEGFMSGAVTAIGLRDAGCRVTIVAATGGRGQYDGRNIAWSLGPKVMSGEFVARINSLVRHGDFDHVLALTEPIQARLADASVSWRDRIYPRVAPWQQRLLGSKRLLSEHVAARGVATPAHRRVRSAREVRAAIDTLGLPVVVKGDRGRGGANTYIVDTLSAAVAKVDAIQRNGAECFLQRYVTGRTYLVGGVFHEGCPVRLYAAEKLAQHPSRTGPGTRLRSVIHGALLEPALAVVRALCWTGIASVDFIRDARGRFLFLELNPRPWGSIAAAAEASVDLFGPLASLLRNELPTPKLEYRRNVETAVLPLAFLSGPRAALAAMRELTGPQARLWWPPRQGMHLAHRLTRVAWNWPR
jgi:hypothetical protein